MGALVPVGGSQPNLRPSTVTKSFASSAPAQEQIGKQMPFFSDFVKNWHCHVPKHALFSFYRNSRKAFICTRVHARQQCCAVHALTPLLDLLVYIQKALTSRLIDKDVWAGEMAGAGCSCRGLQLSSQHPQSSSQCLSPSSGLSGHQAQQAVHLHTCKQHNRIHKIKITLNQKELRFLSKSY